jgi:DedD protein
MAEQKQQDVDTLKRRGRRRLVGAVALVLLAVIVLPMVFDPEPRRSAPPVSVRIPGEDDSVFAPKVTPKAPEKKPEEKRSAAEEKKAPEPRPEEKKAEVKPPEAKPVEAKPAEAERARAEYVIQVGAFVNPEPVIAKLAQAKVKHYTETVATAKGKVTRVRAGPFATKAEADKALETIKGLGLKPGNVGAKTG